MSILVLGYGNPGRRDDGLGPALVARLEAHHLPDVELVADYQLRLEDAASIARHEAVAFVDAGRETEAPFAFEPVAADPGMRFSTHSVSPGALLHAARICFDARPSAWLLTIRGEEFGGFEEGLSDDAVANLDAATEFLLRVLDRRAVGKGVEHA